MRIFDAAFFDARHYDYGVTPAGRYHVRMCDLNASHLIQERKTRTGLRQVLTSAPAIIRDLGKGLELSNLLKLLNDITDRLIPEIPASPGAEPTNPLGGAP